jgi:predicted nucleic acid-binding protein
MSAICLIDTSILVELLNIPNKANRTDEISRLLENKIKEGESLFLPMATILETGNHIAQNGDGDQRRTCAEKFVRQVQLALKGESPFKPIIFLRQEELQLWLDEFPASAMRGSGLGDLSIIHDFHRLCAQNRERRVYIWSLDKHLSAYQK